MTLQFNNAYYSSKPLTATTDKNAHSVVQNEKYWKVTIDDGLVFYIYFTFISTLFKSYLKDMT